MFNITQYTHGPVRFWVFLLLVWTLIWKGLALWKSARKEQKGWFVAMLIINTAGILEILYLYVFSEHRHLHAPAGADRHAPAPETPKTVPAEESVPPSPML